MIKRFAIAAILAKTSFDGSKSVTHRKPQLAFASARSKEAAVGFWVLKWQEDLPQFDIESVLVLEAHENAFGHAVDAEEETS